MVVEEKLGVAYILAGDLAVWSNRLQHDLALERVLVEGLSQLPLRPEKRLDDRRRRAQPHRRRLGVENAGLLRMDHPQGCQGNDQDDGTVLHASGHETYRG